MHKLHGYHDLTFNHMTPDFCHIDPDCYAKLHQFLRLGQLRSVAVPSLLIFSPNSHVLVYCPTHVNVKL